MLNPDQFGEAPDPRRPETLRLDQASMQAVHTAALGKAHSAKPHGLLKRAASFVGDYFDAATGFSGGLEARKQARKRKGV